MRPSVAQHRVQGGGLALNGPRPKNLDGARDRAGVALGRYAQVCGSLLQFALCELPTFALLLSAHSGVESSLPRLLLPAWLVSASEDSAGAE